tara:strand:- start:231 stop:458 length:228 start_codon:yes stop_codon:yes gene_type:complete
MYYEGTINHHEIEFEFEAFFKLGWAGDYNSPPDEDEFELISLTITDYEVGSILSAEVYSSIEEEIKDIVREESRM